MGHCYGLLSMCKSELVQSSNLWVKRVTKLNRRSQTNQICEYGKDDTEIAYVDNLKDESY